MSTLIGISGLGILCLILEILDFRKATVPVVLIGLLAVLGLNVSETILGESLFEIDTHGMMRADGVSRAFSMLFIVLTIFIVLMCPKFYQQHKSRIADYLALKIFLLAGAVAMITFANFIMFFVGLEVLSIAAYILASSEPENVRSNEAGMKYFIMGAVASSFVLFGLALIYGITASFDILEIAIKLNSLNDNPLWLSLGLIMVCVGMLFKISAFPFHFWAPDVYQGSPTIVTSMMSTLVKVAAIGSFFVIITIFTPAMNNQFIWMFVIISILTMTVGNITALKQTNIKRMMAYSGISHAGFMMMTLVAAPTTASTVLYYACAYGFAGIAAFAVIMAVCREKDDEDISHFYGLFKRSPLLTITLAGSLMSLGGIPIFAGFFAKFFLFREMLIADQLILVIAGVVNSIIAIYYYFGVVNVMFTKEFKGTEETIRVPFEYKVVAVSAIILNVLIGLFPSILLELNLA